MYQYAAVPALECNKWYLAVAVAVISFAHDNYQRDIQLPEPYFILICCVFFFLVVRMFPGNNVQNLEAIRSLTY